MRRREEKKGKGSKKGKGRIWTKQNRNTGIPNTGIRNPEEKTAIIPHMTEDKYTQ